MLILLPKRRSQEIVVRGGTDNAGSNWSRCCCSSDCRTVDDTAGTARVAAIVAGETQGLLNEAIDSKDAILACLQASQHNNTSSMKQNGHFEIDPHLPKCLPIGPQLHELLPCHANIIPKLQPFDPTAPTV